MDLRTFIEEQERVAKVVKPTPAEKKKIDATLRRKYPQMYEPGYGNARIMKDFAKARAKATAKKIFYP